MATVGSPLPPFSLKAAFFTPCGVRQAGGNQERLGGVNTAQRQEEESGGAREEGKEESSKGDVERQRGGGGGEIRWQSREESHNARFKAKFTTVDRR